LRNQAEASDGLKIYEIAALAQALLREDASFQPYQVLEADGNFGNRQLLSRPCLANGEIFGALTITTITSPTRITRRVKPDPHPREKWPSTAQHLEPP
jgi:hypothetical protein